MWIVACANACAALALCRFSKSRDPLRRFFPGSFPLWDEDFSKPFPPLRGSFSKSFPPPGCDEAQSCDPARAAGLGRVPTDQDAMAYREVTRVVTKEVLRQWLAGGGHKRIAARVGVDVKTVRRYIGVARALGLERGHGEEALTEEFLTTLMAALQGRPGRQHGEAWQRCEAQRAFIADGLAQGGAPKVLRMTWCNA